MGYKKIQQLAKFKKVVGHPLDPVEKRSAHHAGSWGVPSDVPAQKVANRIAMSARSKKVKVSVPTIKW